MHRYPDEDALSFAAERLNAATDMPGHLAFGAVAFGALLLAMSVVDVAPTGPAAPAEQLAQASPAVEAPRLASGAVVPVRCSYLESAQRGGAQRHHRRRWTEG